MKRLYLLLYMLCPAMLINTLTAQFVVSPDGKGDFSSVQAALNACPDEVQSTVFVRNGVYDEQLVLGKKSAPSKKKIRLIGESAEGVIITHHQYRASSGTPTFEDVCTVKLYANDFYAENITIQNTAIEGMAEALYTAGDRQTFKNCRILGYQDTYRSRKACRAYFQNCWIQGAVDFIYGGGTVFFDKCTLNCVKGGGYIVAPEDRYKYIPASSTASGRDLNAQFIFRNCSITANKNVTQASYVLGRPWNANAGAYFINCTTGAHIKASGWTGMGGNESSASFGEFQSVDFKGKFIDVNERVSWSFQLHKDDVDRYLNPSFVYSLISAIPYDPVQLCKEKNMAVPAKKH